MSGCRAIFGGLDGRDKPATSAPPARSGPEPELQTTAPRSTPTRCQSSRSLSPLHQRAGGSSQGNVTITSSKIGESRPTR